MGNERSKYATSEHRLSTSSVRSIPKPQSELEFQKPPICDKGEFGPVYKAFEQSTGQLYAVKVMPLEKDEKKLALFVNKDITRLQSLKNHPNVVQIIDWKFDKQKNELMVISEYIAGGDLAEYIKVNGAFNPIRALELLYQIIQGAVYLKKTGVIFRELKTKNVLISSFSKNDYDLRLKIGDFGFNKKWYSRTRKFGTKPLNMCMAPEILDSKGLGVKKELMKSKNDQKSIVWSIGIIFYWMVYGKNPFEDEAEVKEKELELPQLHEETNEKVGSFIFEILKGTIERDTQKRMNLDTVSQKVEDLIESRLIDDYCANLPVKEKKKKKKRKEKQWKKIDKNSFPFLTYAQKMNERRKCKQKNFF